MAEQYISYVLTNAGKDIISRVIAGLDITFKRVVLGDGFDYDVENYTARQGLVNEVLSLDNMTMRVTSSNVIELIANFSKSDLDTAFWFREIGIFIVDPDNAGNEILYAYGNRNDGAEYITPHVQNYAILKDIKCLLSVGSSANVNILVSDEQKATSIEFDVSDWVHDETNNTYTVIIGSVQDSIKIFKITDNGKKDTALVDIIRDTANITTLKSLAPFKGCVVCV